MLPTILAPETPASTNGSGFLRNTPKFFSDVHNKENPRDGYDL